MAVCINLNMKTNGNSHHQTSSLLMVKNFAPASMCPCLPKYHDTSFGVFITLEGKTAINCDCDVWKLYLEQLFSHSVDLFNSHLCWNITEIKQNLKLLQIKYILHELYLLFTLFLSVYGSVFIVCLCTNYVYLCIFRN